MPIRSNWAFASFCIFVCELSYPRFFTPFVACNRRLAAEAKVNIFYVQGKLKCIGMIYLHHENSETVLLGSSLSPDTNYVRLLFKPW